MAQTYQDSIGWIGTGRIGIAMATRLANAGCDLAVWNRTRAKAEPLADRGATVVAHPAELAERDIVITSLSDSEAFVEVILGEEGLLSRGRGPRVIVDTSTISAEASETVREAASKADCSVLAAPVSGNAKVVAAGRLALVVSGEQAAFDRALRYLQLLGQSVTYVGDGETARLVKICHNLVLGVMTQVLAETTVLAQRAGVPRSAYLDFINGSVMGSVFTRYKAPALVNLDFTPTFTGHLLRKDFELGLQAGRDLDVPLPLSAEVHQLVMRVIGEGDGDVDFASLLTLAARGAGLELEPENIEVPDGLEPIDDLSTRD